MGNGADPACRASAVTDASVADTVRSRLSAIQSAVFRADSAGAGTTVSKNESGALNLPPGLAIAPNGDVPHRQQRRREHRGDDPVGKQVATEALDTSGSPPGAGALSGLAVAAHASTVYSPTTRPTNSICATVPAAGSCGPGP